MSSYRSILDQIKWADLSGTFSGVGQAFAQGQQLAQRKKEFAAQQKLAQQDADRERAKIEEQMGAKAAEEARRRELYGQGAMLQSVNRLQKVAQESPQAYEQASAAEKQRLSPLIAKILPGEEQRLPDLIPPDQLEPFAQELRRKISAYSDQKQYLDMERKASSFLAADLQDPTMADPQFARQHPSFRKYLERVSPNPEKVAAAGAPKISVNAGAQPLTTPNQTAAQGQVSSGMETLGTLNTIASMAKPEHFTTGGRAKAKLWGWLDNVAPDWLPPDAAKDIETRTELNNNLEQFFNAYRKEITGAAAPMAELEALRNSMLNKDLSWHQYLGAIKQLRSKVSRTVRLYNSLSRQGIPEDVLGDRLNQAYLSGVDANGMREMSLRMTELHQQGYSDDQIKAIVRAEGYSVEGR